MYISNISYKRKFIQVCYYFFINENKRICVQFTLYVLVRDILYKVKLKFTWFILKSIQKSLTIWLIPVFKR